ncbi:hypothetical protein MUU48_21460 [Scandinavium sp. H11S7]|nr:hypothetical protein [Scandinavium hiltneri]MCS2159443.1 hypothetical protein [Scandinavium hiltneri]
MASKQGFNIHKMLRFIVIKFPVVVTEGKNVSLLIIVIVMIFIPFTLATHFVIFVFIISMIYPHGEKTASLAVSDTRYQDYLALPKAKRPTKRRCLRRWAFWSSWQKNRMRRSLIEKQPLNRECASFMAYWAQGTA